VIEKALTGHYRPEHLFVLEQALALYDVYQQKVSACDVQIESVLKRLNSVRGHKDVRADGSGPPRHPPGMSRPRCRVRRAASLPSAAILHDLL
jgi:hypothetical protein